jgi:hypothetical protein
MGDRLINDHDGLRQKKKNDSSGKQWLNTVATIYILLKNSITGRSSEPMKILLPVKEATLFLARL